MVYLWLLGFGLCSGFLAGLLGIGGGFIVVPALLFVLPYLDIDAGLIPTVAVATSLAAMVPTSVSTVLAQHRKRALRIEWVRLLAPGVALGSALGSKFAATLSGTWIMLVFAAYAGLVASRLIHQSLRAASGEAAGSSAERAPTPTIGARWQARPASAARSCASRDPASAPRFAGEGAIASAVPAAALSSFKGDGAVPSPAGRGGLGWGPQRWIHALPQWSVGFFIGGFSALAGVGGASLIVPYLLSRDACPRQASAASSAVGLVIAVVGAAGFGLSHAADPAIARSGLVGFVCWPAALAIGASAIFAAPFGVLVAHRLPVERLKQAFAVLLLIVAAGALAGALR